MKRSMIKTGAAVLCTALALTLFGNTTDVLAYDGESPYEDYGIDVSTRSERDQFYDYQEYAIYVKLREAIGDEYTPELSAIFDEAEAAVYSVNYNSTISLEDNKAQIAEIMDYYLALIDEVKNPVILWILRSRSSLRMTL